MNVTNYKRFKRVFASAVFSLCLLLSFSANVLAQQLDAVTPPKAAPSTPFYSHERGEVTLGDYKGDVIVVNFWATWCAPCVHEMPALHQFYSRHKENGLKVLIISEDFGGFDVILPFLGQRDLPLFEALHDKRNALIKDMGLGSALPASVLIDKKGNIVASGLGIIDWESDALNAKITELLAE